MMSTERTSVVTSNGDAMDDAGTDSRGDAGTDSNGDAGVDSTTTSRTVSSETTTTEASTAESGREAAPADDESLILRTRGLTKRFGQFVAVDGVDLDVRRGEFRSIIGPNGAGKTTLFNLLSGALAVSEGTVTFDGQDVTDLSPAERVRRGMGRSFQISNVFGGLTVRENVRLASQAVHDDYGTFESLFRSTDRFPETNDHADRVLKQVGLADDAERRADALAYGDRRRLEIGVVLATDPEIVLFDEPTAGMSVEETRETIDLVEEVLVDQTLLLIEHDIELVMELSDAITVLHRGEILAEGPPEAIAADESVQDAYLGGMVE